jgi:hypothetical protein
MKLLVSGKHRPMYPHQEGQAMTARDLRLAALWLRWQARATGLKHAEHLMDRRHRPRRTVEQPRDTAGRFTKETA